MRGKVFAYDDARQCVVAGTVNAKGVLDDPALQDEFSTLDALLRARKAAGLTQAQVAMRMGINPASLARIESSLGSHKHSPSLATLRKYAQACGMQLTISLR